MSEKNVTKTYSEAFEQQRLCSWLEKNNINYFAIPNSSFRGYKRAKNEPYVGVKPGVPDLFVCEPSVYIYKADNTRRIYSGLFIEMKRTGSASVSVNQAKWIQKLNELGYKACVAEGYADAKKIVMEYMKGKSDEEREN